MPALRRQLTATEKAIDNLLNAIQAGAFNASVKRRLDEMEETKEKLELSILKEEIRKPQFTREQIQFYILQFRKVDLNTLEGRRRLIDSFVYDDYLLVTFNYKEGAEQITFDQIERSDLSSLGGPDRRFQAFGFWNRRFLFMVWKRTAEKGRRFSLPFLRLLCPSRLHRGGHKNPALGQFARNWQSWPAAPKPPHRGGWAQKMQPCGPVCAELVAGLLRRRRMMKKKCRRKRM